MPVYNAQGHVTAAIESVLAQSWQDLELILVDDGASDGSEKICDEFAQKDRRIVVFHQSNHGLSHARNQALAAARGKYLAFCDHDDIMQPHCLAAAVSAAQKTGASLVKYTYKTEHVSATGTILRADEQILPNKIFTLHELILEYSCFNAAVRGIWNGLYLRDIVLRNSICFDETIRYGLEDFIFNLHYLRHTDRIATVANSGYIHYMRPWLSVSIPFHREKMNDFITTAAVERQLLQEQGSLPAHVWVQHQAFYLNKTIPRLRQAACDMTLRERYAYLRSLNSPQVLQLNCRFRPLSAFKLLEDKRSKENYILFNLKCYRTLIAGHLLATRIKKFVKRHKMLRTPK